MNGLAAFVCCLAAAFLLTGCQEPKGARDFRGCYAQTPIPAICAGKAGLEQGRS